VAGAPQSPAAGDGARGGSYLTSRRNWGKSSPKAVAPAALAASAAGGSVDRFRQRYPSGPVSGPHAGVPEELDLGSRLVRVYIPAQKAADHVGDGVANVREAAVPVAERRGTAEFRRDLG